VRRQFIIEIVGYRLSMFLARQDWRIGSPVRIIGCLDKPMPAALAAARQTPLPGFAGESQTYCGPMTWSPGLAAAQST
jgi:hypothetical protein